MRVAVTGSAGFIGTATKAALEAAGHEVIPFDRVDGNDILGDLSGLEGADRVLHLAGVLGTSELFDTAEEAIEINITGTLRILQWCKENGAGYTGVTLPTAFYGVYSITKHAATAFATAWHRAYGVPTSTVIAFNVYGQGQKWGPGHPQKFVPTFATRAWMGLPLQIWGDGTQTMDVVSTGDLARMFAEAVNHDDDVVFDAGCGLEISVIDFANYVNKVTGNEAGVEFLPMRIGETPTRIKAIGRGWDRLDWKPELNWEDVDAAIEWYKDKV